MNKDLPCGVQNHETAGRRELRYFIVAPGKARQGRNDIGNVAVACIQIRSFKVMIILRIAFFNRMVVMMRRVIAGNKHVADSRGEIVEIIARRVDGYRVGGALHPFVIGTIGNAVASAAALQ